MAEELRHDTQAAISFRTMTRRHSFNYFFLQHKMHIFNMFCELEQVKQQRGRYVVRQITEDFQFAAGLYRRLSYCRAIDASQVNRAK